ncbi:hypothetical protein SLNWT_7119 [Streptomyces albus]|uniref:Uncharacterized protein n=1 Tax=Streptomyces albus (strain ATCC 21838 / DSM 41398 / FERM P-419 / JCM 4703 / NBRC 107858) TaxID=1081613 RepID=A0A0B5F7E2_STRA4|nr:hypothetical protein SLNWT_7119 [Streptomyces albus]AOU81799.1 hypothetical protein SLNHY_7108 [Streptomyces albus]AYN37486.1 hypothetical protein DUI70_6993 [Streptomyces albus]
MTAPIEAPVPQAHALAQILIADAARAQKRWAALARTPTHEQHLVAKRHLDYENASRLRLITAQHGWPGRQLVGVEGATAAWQIALHADGIAEFQRIAERLMHRAAHQGDASFRQWAHLHDRCLLNSGRPQQFGTQYQHGPHGPQRLPVLDPATLNDRRDAVGLPPAAPALTAVRHRLTAHRGPSEEEAEGTSAPVMAAV